VDAHSNEGQRYLNREMSITPHVDFCNLFKSSLSVFRAQHDHCGCVFDTGTEIHPEPSQSVDEEWIDNSVRDVPTQYSVLLRTRKINTKSP